MSSRSSNSVTSISVNNSYKKEEIFLQPIDQQYEKKKEAKDVENPSEFFFDYEQRIDKIIKMIGDSESTDSDSNSIFSEYHSLKPKEVSGKKSCSKVRKVSFTKVFLVEKWEKNADDLIKREKNKIMNRSLLQNTSPFLGTSYLFNDDGFRPRAYSNNFKEYQENDFNLKLSNCLYIGNKTTNSINAVNITYTNSKF